MKIELGKWYRDEDGAVGKAKADGNWFSVCGWIVNDEGTSRSGAKRILSEVTVTDVLPFELVAGKEYETVSPDGKPGPVVELVKATEGDYYLDALPFRFGCAASFCGVTAQGMIVPKYADYEMRGYRIVREHVSPTPIERLEKWRAEWIGSTYQMKLDGLDAIIADLKTGAKC